MKIRTFKTGATRNEDTNKLDYEGFLSVDVLHRFAKYMNKHRKQADGSIREADNWKKGIPKDQYMKSMFRHFVDLWRVYTHGGTITNTEGEEVDIEELLCAMMFNVQGMLHEELKKKHKGSSLQ